MFVSKRDLVIVGGPALKNVLSARRPSAHAKRNEAVATPAPHIIDEHPPEAGQTRRTSGTEYAFVDGSSPKTHRFGLRLSRVRDVTRCYKAPDR